MVVSTAIYPSLRDKVVLITGGAEGIAAAAVQLFCRQGSKVAFFDISESSSAALIEDIKKIQAADETGRYTIPTFYHCDVTNLEQLKQNADKVLKDFGTVKYVPCIGLLDSGQRHRASAQDMYEPLLTSGSVLVNSAASAGAKSRVPSLQVTPESWEFDVNVNLRHVRRNW